LQGFVGAEADLEIEAGEPASIICAAAERLKADVLVIGRGSAAGVFGRLRTNAYAIIRQSPCPVVSV
jgi:nucleotide-binding universal stress UspA family protein